jgi:pentatricopeptide repeat protein
MFTGLAQNGRVLMAREFFDRMPEDKDIMAWNTMIIAHHGHASCMPQAFV